MKELGNKVREAREARDLSQQQLSRLTGVPQSVIDRIERGQVKWSKHTSALETFLGLIETNRFMVPVVGYIGAGAEIFPIDDHAKGDGMDHIPAPPGIVNGIALIVKGDSMWPRFMDGDIVVLDKTQLALDSLLGETCYVQLVDGRCFLKIIQKGTVPGHWNLISHNAPPIDNVMIDRAFPVAWVKPNTRRAGGHNDRVLS